MEIMLNGETFQCDDNATLQDIARAMSLVGKRYAIELNKEIVPKTEHEHTTLSTGDIVEVVQAIGGG